MAIELGQADTAPKRADAPARPRLRLDMRIQLGSGAIGVNERMLFTERLVLLLDTGVSLVEALKAMQVKADDIEVKTDEHLIGGWRLEGREHLYDASFKKHLLSIYNRTIQS